MVTSNIPSTSSPGLYHNAYLPLQLSNTYDGMLQHTDLLTTFTDFWWRTFDRDNWFCTHHWLGCTRLPLSYRCMRYLGLSFVQKQCGKVSCKSISPVILFTYIHIFSFEIEIWCHLYIIFVKLSFIIICCYKV